MCWWFVGAVLWGGLGRQWEEKGKEGRESPAGVTNGQNPQKAASVSKVRGIPSVNNTPELYPHEDRELDFQSPHLPVVGQVSHGQGWGRNWHLCSSSVWAKQLQELEGSGPKSVTCADCLKLTQTEAGQGTPRNSKRDPRGSGWSTDRVYHGISRRRMHRGIGYLDQADLNLRHSE